MAYRQYSDEEKKAYREKKKSEIDALIDEIDKGVKSIFTSEKYKDYLDVMSKFHTYSISNTLLIMVQNPEATLVAGYRQWEGMGRHVKKGEKGISVLAPIKIKTTTESEEIERDEHGNVVYNDDGTEKKHKGKTQTGKEHISFRKTTIFDVSQTEGKPLPEITASLPETVTKEYADAVSSALDNLTHVKHEREHLREGLKGYCSYRDNRIVLSDSLNYDMQIKTHIHETTHYVLHGEDGTQKERPKEQREMQAESVAYVVCKRLGLDTSDYSFGYIAGWGAKDIFQLKAILKDTADVTKKIYAAIDSELTDFRVRTEVRENETAKSATVMSEKEVISCHNNEFIWMYHNSYSGEADDELTVMHISDDCIKSAFKARILTEKVFGYDKGMEVFTTYLRSRAETEVVKNDGSQRYAELKEIFDSDEHELVLYPEIDSAVKNNSVRKYMRQNSSFLDKLEINAAKEGLKPVRSDVAAAMWENGFTIYDREYNKLPSYNFNDISSNDYGSFEGTKDYTLYADHNDFYKQQLFDEIAECAEHMADTGEYALYDCCDEYDWKGYDDDLSITDNVQEALRKNDIMPLQKYVYEIQRECYGRPQYADISNIAANAAGALSEYTAQLKREKELSNAAREKAVKILDKLGICMEASDGEGLLDLTSGNGISRR